MANGPETKYAWIATAVAIASKITAAMTSCGGMHPGDMAQAARMAEERTSAIIAMQPGIIRKFPGSFQEFRDRVVLN